MISKKVRVTQADFVKIIMIISCFGGVAIKWVTRKTPKFIMIIFHELSETWGHTDNTEIYHDNFFMS